MGESGKMEFLTPKDIATRYKISERQVTHLARAGTLPAIKVGKLWRFRSNDIEGWERDQGVDQGELSAMVDEIIEGIDKSG